MDNLTHGLLGLGLGALRRPDAAPGARTGPTDRAVLLGSVLAAELPDVDMWLARGDAVTAALREHRGLTHALAFSPVVAVVATGVACAVFREARVLPVLARAQVAVLLGHLFPDVWTGWGTRLWLPFSDARVALDWLMVVDPWVTLPLLGGALWALRRGRGAWRRALVAGLSVAGLYVAARAGLAQGLRARVARAYPEAVRVAVFPKVLAVTTWRYGVHLPGGGLAVGEVAPWGAPREARRTGDTVAALPAEVRAVPQVAEALVWARLPLASVTVRPDGAREVTVADLRYHLGGEPTLAFAVVMDAQGRVVDTRFERGGSAREVWRRLRGSTSRESLTPSLSQGERGR